MLSIRFLALFFAFVINIPSAHAWIIALNGTSSTGKTTLAKKLQEIRQEKCEILSYDGQVDLMLKEEV